MELLPLLRLAWQRRIAIAVGVVLALVAGLLLRSTLTETREGVAEVRIVIDTPVSQLVDASPKGADSLGWRTELLADLLTTQATRMRIARDAGIAVQDLVVISPSLNTPVVPTTLPRRAAGPAAGASGDYVLTVLEDGVLPVISLQARAPNGAMATRLAAAGAAALKADAVPPVDGPLTQPIVVEDVGAIQTLELSSGVTKKSVAGAAALLLLWCAAVLLVPGAVSWARGEIRRARPA